MGSQGRLGGLNSSPVTLQSVHTVTSVRSSVYPQRRSFPQFNANENTTTHSSPGQKTTRHLTEEIWMRGPSPKVRQWWRPRKAHDSDIRTVTEKAKTVVGIRTEQTAGGASRRAGGEILHGIFYSKKCHGPRPNHRRERMIRREIKWFIRFQIKILLIVVPR